MPPIPTVAEAPAAYPEPDLQNGDTRLVIPSTLWPESLGCEHQAANLNPQGTSNSALRPQCATPLTLKEKPPKTLLDYNS